ncbi:MAG: glucokinase [Parvibaculum sp.]|nr:glucokinase [Parvibaculum sp.]
MSAARDPGVDAVLLVADIGGTHARFALPRLRGRTIDMPEPSVFLTADHPHLEAALTLFLEKMKCPALAGVAVCAAGPVEGRGAEAHISMTNCPWDVTVEGLSRVTGVHSPRLMNDFAALALSVPALSRGDLHPIGGVGRAIAGASAGILGPGTGLGVSALVFENGHEIPVAGEGGHVDLAPSGEREAAIIAHLHALHGHVSAERVLSGPGLVTLYEALKALSGAQDAPPLSAREIAGRAFKGDCPVCVEAVGLFCGWLGAVAGNLALTIGAQGGIYIGGGIVPRWLAVAPGLFDESGFRARFEAKGRFRSYLEKIPAFVIRRADPALLGLARAAREAAG